MTTASSTASPRDLSVIGLVGAAHFGSHFFQLVLPPLFPWLKGAFGVGYTELGLVMTLFFATSGIAQAFAGVVVDRVGALPVLVVGKILLAGGAILAAFAPSYEALLPIAVAMGLGNSVYHPADYSILSHKVAPRRLARAYSIHTIGGTLGWAAAPVLMVALATAFSWRVALLTSGITALFLAGLLVLNRDRLRIPAAAPATAGRAPVRTSIYLAVPVLACFAYFALASVALSAVQAFLPLTLNKLYGTSIVVGSVGVTCYMVGSAVGTLAGGFIADHSGRLQGIIIGGIAGATLVVLLLALVPMPDPLILVTAAAIGALSGVTTPSRDLLVRSAAPEGATGKVFGFVYSGLDLGGAVTPAVIGALLDHGQPRMVLLLVAASMALTILTVTNIRTRAEMAAATA